MQANSLIPKKILIIDDDHFARIGIRHAIHSIDGTAVIHEADSPSSGLAAMRTTSYTFCLLDLTFTDDSCGIEGLKKIRSGTGVVGLPILCLSSNTDSTLIRRAFDLGACTYLIKGASQVEDLRHAIDHALKGEIYIPPCVRAIVANTRQEKKNSCLELLHSLPERQYQVAELMLLGLSQKVIAQQLGIQISTVKTHASSIYARFGVEMRGGLMAKFLAEGAVPIQQPRFRRLAEDRYQL
jgi:two-component system nitrate/nitrite response regulator NarL